MSTVAVKERPILFSGAMVRAILDGRKTQTRRIVKALCCAHCKCSDVEQSDDDTLTCLFCGKEYGTANLLGWGGESCAPICPYGQPGDRLWVKETHRQQSGSWPNTPNHGRILEFRADGWSGKSDIPWRPSIFMPRWASRITLEITGIRAERLQDISAGDCFAEGIERPKMPTLGSEVCVRDNARNAFRNLWESINGEGSWAANPFVWVVDFRRDWL